MPAITKVSSKAATIAGGADIEITLTIAPIRTPLRTTARSSVIASSTGVTIAKDSRTVTRMDITLTKFGDLCEFAMSPIVQVALISLPLCLRLTRLVSIRFLLNASDVEPEEESN